MNIQQRTTFVTLSVIVTLLAHWPARAQSTTAPGSWGVNVHTPYRGPALEAIGTQWVRLDMQWTSTETSSKGHYDWTGADKAVTYYQSNGFHIILVLGIAKLNQLYQDQAPDRNAVSKAIASWSAAAAQHFKGKGILWEIGNEPEVAPMDGYWNNPATYGTMARLVSKMIKQADPSCTIAALAMAWMDRPFATAALKAGLLADGTIDYLSFHGYHRTTIQPESGLEDDVGWLRAQAANATPSGATVPQVIDTETGYAIAPFDSPKTKDNWRLFVDSEDTQAAYLARHYFEEISLAIPISIWYKDMFGEQSYSLYYADEKDPRGLRPMGRAFRTLAALLPDNPASLQNHQFAVSIKAKSDVSKSAPRPDLFVRSFLRSTPGHAELIVAVWNAVEAFDGKIVQSRTFVGNQVMELTRGITSSDLVLVPVELDIESLRLASIRSAAGMSLPDGRTTGNVAVRANSSGDGVAMDATAQPTPFIIRLSIDAPPGNPTDLRVR